MILALSVRARQRSWRRQGSSGCMHWSAMILWGWRARTNWPATILTARAGRPGRKLVLRMLSDAGSRASTRLGACPMGKRMCIFDWQNATWLCRDHRKHWTSLARRAARPGHEPPPKLPSLKDGGLGRALFARSALSDIRFFTSCGVLYCPYAAPGQQRWLRHPLLGFAHAWRDILRSCRVITSIQPRAPRPSGSTSTSVADRSHLSPR